MAERVLGVEGGGTKTAWVLLRCDESSAAVVERGKLPPSNLRLTHHERLRAMLGELPREVDRAGVFLAGCVTAQDRDELSALCRGIWPAAHLVTGSDRDSGLAAALQDRDGIAVNAGTGSSVTGRRGGRIEKAGGWGHILGDIGGGYYLSIEALRLLLREYDLHRGEAEFAAEILRALSLNNFDELVRWAQTADKMQTATLAPIVFAAAEQGDARVRQLLENGASMLAQYTAAVAGRLEFANPEVRLLGGLFQCCDIYRDLFRAALAPLLPGATVQLAEDAPEFGAAWLARRESSRASVAPLQAAPADPAVSEATTEQQNPRSTSLETLSARELVDLFVDEESCVQDALRAAAPQLASALEIIGDALREWNGRLFYVGAGTSGRLGVLDASEIPPTFGAPPDLVQGIIAGGAAALHRSVEGAEDEPAAGALAVKGRGVRAGDVVVGIAASGRTPFVVGALHAARTASARTILLTCNPAAASADVDLQINLATGPELLAGSTRLKAGTATKVALNIFSTGAMIRLGKVRGNLMIDLAPTNEKLRVRAARLVAQLTGCSYDEAVAQLTAVGWNVRAAISAKGG